MQWPDLWRAVDAFLKAGAQLIQDGRKPWSRDEMRALVAQLDGTLLHRRTQFNRATIAIGVGVALLFGGLCAGGGWWSWGVLPAVVGVRAGAGRCDDRPDGSRLCWVSMWERLPPTKPN